MRIHKTGDERAALAVHVDIDITGREISQYLILFPKTLDHPVLAIESPAFEMLHLPLAFSGQGDSLVGGRCDGSISE